MPLTTGAPPSGASSPGKADAVVVHVDLACPAEPVAGEALVHAVDHGVDAGVAIGLQHGVDVGRGLGPDFGDEVAPTLAVGLVPHGEVLVDEFGDSAHAGLLLLAAGRDGLPLLSRHDFADDAASRLRRR